MVVSLGINIYLRRWRRAISTVAAPIIAGSLFFLVERLGITTELACLEIRKSSYLAQVDALPATDSGIRFKIWDWGAVGGAGVGTVYAMLVYDDSDQIALPRSSWSSEWLRNADRAAEGSVFYSVLHPESFSQDVGLQPGMNVRHLDGHFYVVDGSFL